MNPRQRTAVKGSLVVRPVVRSDRGRRALEASMRRLGVDEPMLETLTGRAGRRRPRTS
jgi:hypothetical protein